MHARIQKIFSERGSNTDVVFFFFFFFFFRGDGEMIEMLLKVGCHRPASETPLKWHFAGMPIMAHY